MKTSASLVLALLVSLTLGACASGPAADIDDARAADANATLGINYLREGNNELALEKLQRALSFQDDHVKAHWGLALVHERLDQAEKAEDHFERALSGSSNPGILNSYGAFLCDQGRTDAAIEHFEQAADDPRYTNAASALTNAGICLRRAGRRQAAANFLKRALEKKSEYSPALAAMARLRYAGGEHLNARAFFQRHDAVEPLTGKLLLLAVRNELALGDRTAAGRYLKRYNEAHREAEWTLDELASKSD